MRQLARTSVLAGLLGACSGGRSPCDIHDISRLPELFYCRNATNLAIRYSDKIVVAQADVDYYYDLSAKAYMKEPITRLAGAATATDSILAVPLFTRNASIIGAWGSGQLVTGDVAADALFAANSMVNVEPWLPPEGDEYSFNATFPTPISYDALDRRIGEVADTRLAGTQDRSYNDVSVVSTGDPVKLHMVGGWGDCFPGCAYFHSWDADIYSSGEVIVTDLGGDPIPSEIASIVLASPDP